ncbi:MAG: sigma-70 family RNA polymerase sigma factor, partial [Acetobacteraceae bacterium]
ARHRRPGLDLLDLVGAGHLGLHMAISRFDPTRFDTRLSAYAAGWIRYYIRAYIRRNASLVRLPESHAHRQLAQMSGRLLADARRTCLREGINPTEAALCERIGARIGMPATDVAQSLRLLQGGMLSLQAPSNDGGDAPSLENALADIDAASEDDVILRIDRAKVRRRVLGLVEEILGERERAVFLARCMTGAAEPARLETLAQTFGVSRERIHQLEASARRKIATALANEGFMQDTAAVRPSRPAPVRAARRPASPACRPREALALDHVQSARAG